MYFKVIAYHMNFCENMFDFFITGMFSHIYYFMLFYTTIPAFIYEPTSNLNKSLLFQHFKIIKVSLHLILSSY